MLFTIIVASVYFFATSPAQHYADEWEGFTVYVCVGLFLLFRVLAVWWHELGHYLAGRVTGAQLWGFFAWPLVIYPDLKGWRVQLGSVEHLWGCVFDIPAWPVPGDFPRRYFVSVLAGPFASLVMALSAFGLERALGWYAPSQGFLSLTQQLIGVSLWLIVLVGLLDFLFNLVPFSVAGHMSDGMQLLHLLFRTRAWRRIETRLHLYAMQTSALSPGDWDRDLLEEMVELHTGEWRHYALAALYYLTLERRSPAEAEPHLARCLSHVSSLDPTLAAEMYLEAAYYAVYGGELEKARAWIEAAEAAPDKRRVRAAVALLEGDTGTAITLIDEVLEEFARMVGTRFDTGMMRAERLWLLRLRERAVGETASALT